MILKNLKKQGFHENFGKELMFSNVVNFYIFWPSSNCIKTLLLLQLVLHGYLILRIIVGFDFLNYFKIK